MIKRIAVLVSGGGTNLQCIIDGIKSGIITNAEISVVISSNYDAYALRRAEKAGIKTEVLNREYFLTANEFERETYSAQLSELIEKYDTDLIVMAGFMTILSYGFIVFNRSRTINVHPSLIPAFCGDGMYGLRPHEAAIERGVKLAGATVHFVNEVADGGPIILQKAIDVKEWDTPATLQQRVMTECEQVILPKAIDLFCNDRIEMNGKKAIIKD